MTCETKTKPDGKQYTYLKCNTPRAKCSQKPINEKSLFAQIEAEFCSGIKLTDSMLEVLKKAVREKLKEDSKIKASNKGNITIKIAELKEQEKQLFKYLLQHKCDEATFNENREEIREEISKLEKSAEKYEEDLNDIEANLDKIAEIAANAGILLKSPIVEEKKAILKLLLSDCKIEGKNLCFSIVKPFDVLIKTAETEKWCR